MAIFLSYNEIRDFESAGILDQFSFAAFGQANTVCSKAPVLTSSDSIEFIFACNDDYRVNRTLSSGLLTFDINEESESLKNISSTCYESE